jgi:secondary thiamine-phosphate synthase enzyme
MAETGTGGQSAAGDRTKASSVQPISNPTTTTANGMPASAAPPELNEGQRLERHDDEVDLAGYTPVVMRRRLTLLTERAFHVTDVTDECADLLRTSGVREGTLSVFSEHTTCAVKINERETCFLEDLRLFMEKLVPQRAYYFHDDFEIRDPRTLAGTAEEEPVNGHAHIKQMLLGCSSETVPVVGGVLALGRWQRIMFIELDQSRPRSIRLQVQGWR